MFSHCFAGSVFHSLDLFSEFSSRSYGAALVQLIYLIRSTRASPRGAGSVLYLLALLQFAMTLHREQNQLLLLLVALTAASIAERFRKQGIYRVPAFTMR